MNYRITHTELWPYKQKEHDDITLPRDAMLRFLGEMLLQSNVVEIEDECTSFKFWSQYTRADGDIGEVEHLVWVERIEEEGGVQNDSRASD